MGGLPRIAKESGAFAGHSKSDSSIYFIVVAIEAIQFGSPIAELDCRAVLAMTILSTCTKVFPEN